MKSLLTKEKASSIANQVDTKKVNKVHRKVNKSLAKVLKKIKKSAKKGYRRLTIKVDYRTLIAKELEKLHYIVTSHNQYLIIKW